MKQKEWEKVVKYTTDIIEMLSGMKVKGFEKSQSQAHLRRGEAYANMHKYAQARVEIPRGKHLRREKLEKVWREMIVKEKEAKAKEKNMYSRMFG